jgi:hypothetical protein
MVAEAEVVGDNPVVLDMECWCRNPDRVPLEEMESVVVVVAAAAAEARE